MKTLIRNLGRNLKMIFLFDSNNYYLEQYAKELGEIIESYSK